MNTTEIGTAMLPLRSVTIPARADVSPSALAYVRACVRTAGDAGQVAWRIPAASAAGIVRSGPGAGRDVREWETDILCASEPDGSATGAGALPGARRRCEAGKRTHGRGPRACLALLAAAALLALAAPAQAQTEVWSATLTPADIGSGVLGCSNGVSTGRCSSTSLLSEDSFNYDSTDYNITALFLRPDGRFQFQVDAAITTATAALTLVVGSTALVLAAATIIPEARIWNSSGVSLTAGTDITVKLTAPGTPNTAAMGAPTITGTAQVGQTLTAVTTGITDADGLTSPTYTYQWIRVDGTDEEDISGENSSTYTLVDADLGKTIKVKVSFTDDASNAETLTSAATATVAADTTPPEVESAGVVAATTADSLLITFDENLDQTAVSIGLGSAFSVTADGQLIEISLISGFDAIVNLRARLSAPAIRQGQTVVVSYADPTAGDDTVALQDIAGNDVASFTTGMAGVPAVTNNSTSIAPTGAPTITGTAQVGETLTAVTTGIADANGLTSPTYTYQWIRANGTEADIASANSSTYTLDAADLGKTIKVKVSFTDDTSNAETLTSAATVTVTAAGTTNTAPTAADNTVTTGEDRPYTFMAGDFGFDDADAGATLASVTIVTVPALGTLALDGTAVLADDVVTKAQIDGDMLTFTPARDAHGASYTTFTFTVNDGTDDSASAYTMTIDVTDAPLPVCGVPDIAGAGRRQIWTSTMTVEARTLIDVIEGYGFSEFGEGELALKEFDIGSNNYTIDAILVGLRGRLVFSLDGNTGSLTATETAALRLHVCDEDYDFSTATTVSADISTFNWTTSLDWSPPVESRTVYLSLPANNVATGEPAITGTAQAGQELTADASPIMDADGVPSSFTYKWFRVDSDGTSNEAEISGEIAETYTLTTADVGKKTKVQVSFTDELSGEEERTSAAYPSSGTVTTAASTTAPALTSVTVTSTPRKTTDTYGAREHIEFSMTFDAPVTVTGDPTFAFDLGGPTTASWYAGSGTTTLRFSHAVTGGSMGDRDTNGIAWAENAIALNGGTIAGTDNAVAAVLTHVAQSNLADHKVDGRTTAVTAATVTDVVVTSTPMLMASGSSTADTYGFGETIVITVTVSEAVEVEGDPVFRFSLTNPGSAANNPQATYDRTRSIATTIVFTYTVQAGDRDTNGIWIGTHSQTFSLDANDRIRTASQQIDIDRNHLEKGTQGGHKVDGSLGAPTVPPDPTAPTLVSATATTLTIEWTHPGDGGSPLTRNFIEYRVEGTTDWTNWYRGETPTTVTRTVITNLQAETAYDVRVHATNAIGNSSWTQSATAFSTLAGNAATGAPTISGTLHVGRTQTASPGTIADADGLTNASYSYQWIWVDGTDEEDISGATAATYFLTAADVGKALKVRASFTDDAGNAESRTSAPTATVEYGDPPTLGVVVGVGQGVLWWTRPGTVGLTLSHYEYRYSEGGMILPTAIWQQVQAPGGTDPIQAYYQVVKGLTSDTTHTFQVRAATADAKGAPATVTATPLSQPSCTIDELGDRRLLWQGQLTAGVRAISTDGNVATGYGEEEGTIETGTLTPDAVTFRSTTYSVITWTRDEHLHVVLVDQESNFVWYPRDEVVDALRWHVCNTLYDFSSAAVPDLFSEFAGYRWNVGFNWPPGIERTLRLSLPPNHPATGDPVISGTVQVGAELTALTDGIMDEDELDDVFTYQWVRVDADGTSNEEDITDATDATYTLTADERGKKVKVEVRFVDILGGEETRTSAPTETLPGVTVSTPALTVTEEDTTGATYTVVLNSQPTATVTVTVAGHAGTDVSLTPSSATLTFTPTTWGTAQTVTVTAGPDADTANDSVSLTHSAASTDSDYQGITIAGVAVTVTDNDDNDTPPGVTVSTPALTVTEEDTAGASYTVVLDSQPTATVTVTVAGHAGTDVSLTPSSATLTFTPMTWGTTQTVTVTAGADADTANDAVTLTHSAASTDSDYGGISIDGVAVTVTDNDDTNTAATGKPTITGTAQVGETLTAVTTGIMDVDGLTNPEYKYQWIRVNGPEADIADANSSTYTLGAADLGTTLKVRVTFRDDDKSNTETRTSAATETVVAVAMTTPGVTVSKTALTVTEEDTTGATYTVVLDSQPTATVTVTVAGHAGTDVTPSPTSLTFTTTTWGTAQTVTVTAGADADTANDAVTLTHSAASTDTGYEGISIDGVAVTVTDNDNDAPPGVTVSTSALTVTEEDPTGARYTVVLDSQPTATVTVTVAGHAGTDVTPSPTSLTFTPMTWGTAQTVTVTAGPDADTANDAVSLTHSAASTDSNYQGITIGGVAVTVRDNDTPPPSNNVPTVSSVSCDPCAVAPGGEVRLSAEASDPDGDSLTYAWSAPTGSFTGATDGAAARWRAPAETARVTVRVQVSDGRGGTASATVTVEVGANAPPAFEQSSYGFELPEHEDGRRRPVALGAVQAEDPDDDAVTYSLASGDGERFAVGAHDGAVTYVGAGEDFEAEPNQYELSVRARDQHGAAARVRVTVAVTNANEPPSAEDDEAGTAEDQRVVIDVLANDTDPDGDSLRVESVSAPAHGMARVASRGGVAYTPDADYHGMDRFTYVVADGHGETAAAAVEVTVAPVNDAPMAAGIIPDQRLSVGDEPGSLDLRPFFDDRDGDPLSYTAVASDTAVAVGLTDATLTLTVARPGAAMVTVTAQDPGGLTATQAFMVTMTDRQARGVIEDTLAALGRGHLASARATLGRRVETTGQEPSHVTVAGLHVPLGAGARGVAAAGQAVAERWITGLAGGMSLQTGGWAGTDAGGAPGAPAATLGMAAGAPFGAADPAQLGARATPALSGVSPVGGGGQTDFLLALGSGQAGSDAAQGPRWTVWGQSDLQSFAGERSPTARYDGELWTTYVGVDARLSERWLAGVAVSRSRGDGDWTVGASTGRLTTTLTSVQPYLRWSDGGTTIWATGGGGPGTARNALYGRQAESDLGLRLGLVEVRRRLATVGGGVELQLRGDASWARLTTAEGNGLIDALAVEVRQLRVGIDVSRPVRTAGGTLVEPFGEVHARRDGGAGQTGVGLEVAGGLRVARGVFRVEGMGRLLALHAADGYRERGAAVTLSVGDGARQPGLTLSLSPRWGAQATASDALWQDQLFHQRTAGAPGGRRDERALDARVDYGLPLPAGGLLTPFGIYGQSRYGRRLQVGLLLSRLGPVGLEVSGERAALRQPGRDDYRISALGSITFGGADHAPASLSAGQEAHRPRARDHTPRHR